MSGRGGQDRDRGGRGGCVSRGCKRGSDHYTPTLNKNKSLCSALGNNFFKYGQKGASDQIQMTWENIINHVGNIYGNVISNELQNKTKVSITKHEYTEDVQSKHNIARNYSIYRVQG